MALKEEFAVTENAINEFHELTEEKEIERLNVTQSAINKVRELIEEEGNLELKLRVFISGGGCAGFQYGFTFDEIINEDDIMISRDKVVFLIDSTSYQYLEGAVIDYVDSLEGAQFTIKNPNAITTCGCGSSFSI